jgi:hypothetical protein
MTHRANALQNIAAFTGEDSKFPPAMPANDCSNDGLSLATLNAELEIQVFAEPRNDRLVRDLMTLIGGQSNPTVTFDQIRDATYRVTLHLVAG